MARSALTSGSVVLVMHAVFLVPSVIVSIVSSVGVSSVSECVKRVERVECVKC